MGFILPEKQGTRKHFLFMKIWRLKREAEKRFHGGHPWVYSNELMESPKGLPPGDEVLLKDAGGEKTLARGYGNPHSLIAFRALTRNPREAGESLEMVLETRLRTAWEWRVRHGLESASFRWAYAESDGVPGLILDRFLLEGGKQVIVAQPQTAGAERWIEALEALIPKIAGEASIVIRGDAGARTLEGIPARETKVIQGEGDLSSVFIQIRNTEPKKPNLLFAADLLSGQKTGFFLDQTAHIQAAANLFQAGPRKRVRVLDLFSHAGQWGILLGKAFQDRGLQVEVVAMDSSQKALELAKAGFQKNGIQGSTIKADLLESFQGPPGGAFDLVICDPPALIPSKKDLANGVRAYRKVFGKAWSLVAPGGSMVASSCSYHMDRVLFRQALSRAIGEDPHAFLELRGGNWDHPGILGFPEADYLKLAWVERR